MTTLPFPFATPDRSAVPAEPLRVLMLCGAHAEIEDTRAASAAMILFRRLRQRSDIDPVLVAARRFTSLTDASGVAIHKGRRDEFVASTPALDPLTLCSKNAAERDILLADLIDHSRPDVIHLLGIEGFGIDAVDLIAARGLPMILTLVGDLAQPGGRESLDPKTAFGRARLFGSYLARVNMTIAPNAFSASQLLATCNAPSLQIVVGPNRIEKASDARAVVPPLGSGKDGDGHAAGLLKPRRVSRPISLAVILSDAAEQDRAFLEEALAYIPIGIRRRFKIALHAERLSLDLVVPPRTSGQEEAFASEEALNGIVPIASVQPVGDAAALRKIVGAQDLVVVFSQENRVCLDAAAEAISQDVPFLHSARAEIGSSDALGATAFDPDAPSHLAHCLLSFAKAAKPFREIQRRARQIENDEAVDLYVAFYSRVVEEHLQAAASAIG